MIQAVVTKVEDRMETAESDAEAAELLALREALGEALALARLLYPEGESEEECNFVADAARPPP
jgi:hypothetical protein